MKKKTGVLKMLACLLTISFSLSFGLAATLCGRDSGTGECIDQGCRATNFGVETVKPTPSGFSGGDGLFRTDIENPAVGGGTQKLCVKPWLRRKCYCRENGMWILSKDASAPKGVILFGANRVALGSTSQVFAAGAKYGLVLNSATSLPVFGIDQNTTGSSIMPAPSSIGALVRLDQDIDNQQWAVITFESLLMAIPSFSYPLGGSTGQNTLTLDPDFRSFGSLDKATGEFSLYLHALISNSIHFEENALRATFRVHGYFDPTTNSVTIEYDLLAAERTLDIPGLPEEQL